jgi:hypothetical protein
LRFDSCRAAAGCFIRYAPDNEPNSEIVWRNARAAAREALGELGYATTADYLTAICELVLRETTLLPHVNIGVITEAEEIYVGTLTPALQHPLRVSAFQQPLRGSAEGLSIFPRCDRRNRPGGTLVGPVARLAPAELLRRFARSRETGCDAGSVQASRLSGVAGISGTA